MNYKLTKEKETKNKVVYGDGEQMHIYLPKEDIAKLGNPDSIIIEIKKG